MAALLGYIFEHKYAVITSGADRRQPGCAGVVSLQLEEKCSIEPVAVT